jgi:glycyl-tRNA synthetase
MAFIVKKKIGEKEYYYLNENKRIDGKVKTKTLAYLGKTKKEAEKKAKKFLEKMKKRKFIDEKREFKEKKKEISNEENKKEEIENKYDKILELASRKSIFYPAAEIYPNSPSGFWDFGPVGQAIRRKIIDFWRYELVQKENMLEIHGSQILPASVFEGSGHLKSFADPIVQCLKCKKFERADKIISEKLNKHIPESTPIEKLDELIRKNNIRCQKCNGEFSKVSRFNMMVETLVGLVGKENVNKTFLRPEACQSIFLNFARLVKTMRLKLPQGIAQAGGAFRNEISPRQSITRAIEFSQMEAEIFFDPAKINEIDNFDEVKNYKIRILRLGKKEIEEFSAEELVNKKIVHGKLIAYFLARTQQVWNKMGIPLAKLRFREVDKDERAFYSLATFDFEVETSLGWLELIANNYRADYDLKGHMQKSKTNLEYVYEDGKRIIPHVWEISAGIDRTMFAILDTALKKGKEGLYFSLNPKIAPYHCAVLPIVNKENLIEIAKEIEKTLKDSWFDVFYDSSGSIGRRYARQDEIGTPFCITIDGESLENKDVTLRERDTGKQVRIKINNLSESLRKAINGEDILKLGKLVDTRKKLDNPF